MLADRTKTCEHLSPSEVPGFQTYDFLPYNGTLCYCCPHIMSQKTRAVSPRARPDRWAQSP